VLGAFSASLLDGSMVMCFAGFLTPYDVDDFENALSRVLGANEAPVFCTLRTRKCCEVFL
jgi:NAD+ kinase